MAVQRRFNLEMARGSWGVAARFIQRDELYQYWTFLIACCPGLGFHSTSFAFSIGI